MADGIHAEPVAAEFLEHAQQEQQHADRSRSASCSSAASRISPPTASPGARMRSTSRAIRSKDMIRENLIAERIAIDSYREMAHYIGEKDPTTRRLLEEILATEEEHADDLVALMRWNARPISQLHTPIPRSDRTRAAGARDTESSVRRTWSRWYRSRIRHSRRRVAVARRVTPRLRTFDLERLAGQIRRATPGRRLRSPASFAACATSFTKERERFFHAAAQPQDVRGMDRDHHVLPERRVQRCAAQLRSRAPCRPSPRAPRSRPGTG